MLGGGVFVTRNKTLPGSYINFINASNIGSNVGDRGVVAIALPLGKAVGTVIEISKQNFIADCSTLLGKSYNSDEVKPLREIFAHAQKAVIYDLGASSTKTVAEAVSALEPYDFNVLCAYTSTALDITAYINAVKGWRDNAGKKCQLVVYNATTPNHEGIINVVSTVSDDDADEFALTAWVAGAEAGCAVNASITNLKYDGEYTIVTNMTQTQLENAISGGKFAFHNVYGEIRVLEDINSLTTTTDTKSDDFKYNQTIRVIDQIANDIARLFNTKYLGKIPNNASGRVSLWADIVAHHRKLEEIQAIENFDATLVTVEPGDNKRSVVVNDCVIVVNSMSQLYMTVVIQ